MHSNPLNTATYTNELSLTHCLICCPVEIEAKALENDNGTPETGMCPDMNTGHLAL